MTIGAGPMSSQAFVPNKLAFLKLWLDSSDGAFTLSAASLVSQWSDKGSEGNDLLQSNSSLKPILQPDGSLLFDGVDDFMKAVSFPSAQPTTIYFLMRQITFNVFTVFIDGEIGASGIIRQQATSPDIGASAGVSVSPLSDLALNVYGVVQVVFFSSSSLLQLNKEAPLFGNMGNTAMQGFSLGGLASGIINANFQVKEIVVYNAAHDATQREEVVDYLIGKFVPFAPSDFPGLEMEMDTLEPGPDTIIGGGLVSQWGDKSGNGHHLIQATGSQQPSVELDGSFLFDGVDDFMKAAPFALNQPFTMYILFRQLTFSVSEYICDGDTPGTVFLRQQATSPDIGSFAGMNLGPLTTLSLGADGVVVAVYNGASSVLQLNNDTPILGNAGTNNLNGFTLGARADGVFNTNIRVKAILTYGAAHDASQRKTIVDYLNDRYT